MRINSVVSERTCNLIRMKLKDLGDFLIFDSFPLTYDAKNKIILTHLLHLEQQELPKKLSTIYTTKKLADRFNLYCQGKAYSGNLDFVYLEPLSFVDIFLEKKRAIRLMVCESQELPCNLMALIMENDKLCYIYGGNFLDIRTALLEDTFADLIKHGTEKLYINLKRWEETHEDLDVLNQSLNNIEDIINLHDNMRFLIYVPLCGYENFIEKLANRFRKHVTLVSSLFTFCRPYFDNNENFASNSRAAKIFVKEDIQDDLKDPKGNYDDYGVITINVITEKKTCQSRKLHIKNFCYNIYYTPEPSPFDLQLLCLLCKPSRIYGIVDVFNNTSKVPDYLHEFCSAVTYQKNSKLKSPTKNKTPILVGTVDGTKKRHHVETVSGGQFLSDSDD